MGKYHILGGNKINGEIDISGAKNSILPILTASILNTDISIIHNCPRISDTFVAIEILKSLGCKVNFEGNTIIVDSYFISKFEVPQELVRKMRSSIIFLGSLLGKFKNVKISYPGGCELGTRAIDIHIKGIKELGAEIIEEHGYIFCKADDLIGRRIYLDFPSVGATENIILSSVYAKGTTIISNAAKEPEILDLQNFLNKMGAKINGAGTDTIFVEGVKKLHSVEYTIMPDRIVTGTYLTAAAMTKGEVFLNNIVKEDIYPIVTKLSEIGCKIELLSNRVFLKGPNKLKNIEKLRTHPHPGFPSDMQPQLVALLSIAEGNSIVEETIFESRNKHIPELIRMRANIVLSQDGRTFVIKGSKSLDGTIVEAKDLRGGVSLILAGLVANGETIVLNSHFVERGYESIERDLKKLGANIFLEKNQ